MDQAGAVIDVNESPCGATSDGICAIAERCAFIRLWRLDALKHPLSHDILIKKVTLRL